MFDTLKIYTHKEISLDQVEKKIIELGYRRVDEVLEEGDFSLKGDTLEIHPINFNFPLRLEWEFEVVRKIYSFDKTLNKKIIDYEFLIVIPHHKITKRYSSEDFPLEAVLRLKRGDYVVHSRYGIGRFLGIKKLKLKEKEDYYFEIEYENKDKLYVSKEEAHLIQKYVGFSLRSPKLNRLGSKEWTRTKERVERGIKEFVLELLRMEAQRKLIGGFKFSKDTEWQKIFEDSFPYEETDGQIKAMLEVKKDMEKEVCMDRIICGDVGYGKTEVAMRAAFKAVTSAKQVAFLVPTTILAYQHYTNLLKRLQQFPIRAEMLSRFRTPSQQEKIVKDLREGKIDIIVGTHRLLSDDVSFKDLGLLVIDEEHRFGVEHKEKIKKLKVGVDILILTATPIPRTLYMGLIGIKNISLIKTPPKERLAVKTKVVQFNNQVLKEAILREVGRSGQVFFIHNRIETIIKWEKILRSTLPKEIKIAVIHGRLTSSEIEKVMLDFIEKKIDCLLSTAIVESGIDIPSANTMIITDAHTFGLADLHQLRGRVGRFNVQAYAYLVVPNLSSVSTEARKRLELIEEFSHLGAGFEVAMSDLELRGAGNILGSQQHGFVWMVGFDLYCRLLKKEIEYLKQVFRIEVG
ncbi:MAG: CarD family transcriptional regulator [Candidatus Omnitrophota bacterium]|nr:CarD family transcriptional regulator [Candidatus Omnitrophota bacterium]